MNASSRLIEMTDQVFIVAHKEDTTRLESTLTAQGFKVRAQRGPYSEEQQRFSSAMKCFVNHQNVWRQVAAGTQRAIVVEADFVPVRAFGTRPSPLPDDVDDQAVGFAWLYSAGSTLYGFDRRGFPHGHGNTTVAYVLTPRAASMLLVFFDREIRKTVAGGYLPWETYMGVYLRRECGILNYIPTYLYGEHGGLPQPEHAKQGVRAWHQADILMDRLEYLPGYAKGSWLRYLAYRLRSIARGWVRLVLLRFFDPRYINKDTSRGIIAMAWFSLARLLKLA